MARQRKQSWETLRGVLPHPGCDCELCQHPWTQSYHLENGGWSEEGLRLGQKIVPQKDGKDQNAPKRQAEEKGLTLVFVRLCANTPIK